MNDQNIAMLRRGATAVALVTVALGTIAATSVSPKFDGAYSGNIAPNAALSSGDCKPIQTYGVTIAKGMLQGGAPTGKGSTSAIVTEDGFVTGRVVMDGKSYPLEGRIIDNTLMAGLITGNCTWIVKLNKNT